MDVGPGESISVETVNLGEQAKQEIAAAREAGVDPLVIARTHESLARIITHLIAQEVAS